MAAEFGYAGKILKVDLSSASITFVPTSDYADRFIGGRGIGAKIYWDEVSPKAKAFDPENRLIFANGPLAGFAGLAGSRWQVCGKSPAATPELFSYANFGGSWGAWLKFAGYDAIVIQGKSDKPVYIWIEDGNAEIRDASFLWGKGAIEVRETLKGMLGREMRVAAIGPAGDTMAVMANIIADDDSSGSGGFGAVMGSKKLKAIAVGSHKRRVIAAYPEKLQELVKHARSLKKDSRFIFCGPHRMWSAYVPENLTLNPKLKKAVCYGCISGCTRATYEADNGERGKYLCVAAVFYADPSKKMGEWNDVHFQASKICNDYGLDVISLGAIIGWFLKCYQAGILTEKNTGIPVSKIGSLEFIQTLARNISLREGFGDILAQGILKAADVLGSKAKEQLAHWINDRTGTPYPYEPRIYVTNGISFVTEPRLPMPQLHEVIFPVHLWWDWCNKIEGAYVSGDVVRSIARKFLGSEIALDFSTYEGKALAAKKIQDRVYVKECLVLCDFAWPMMDVKHSEEHVGDPTLPSKVFSAVTGREMDEQKLDKIGERVFNLQRAILIREGHRGRESDSLPEYFHTVPLPVSPGLDPNSSVPGKKGEILHRAGAVVDREKFEKMKDEYYQLRGWDIKSGLQTKAKLMELGLEDIIKV
ncbi:MAG TPA: aldehyde ferredoxin oxidoreductase N-terminal domain-containing protein [Thermodesulfobacteriota bacterium]|nr:aldehyde ferredoxin oxidoreductase N-terminal domain-containing protein [Thermodesulfobacteriota bacterium]